MTTTTDVLNAEPATIRIDRRTRSISYVWDLGSGPDHYGEEATIQAVLTCTHYASSKQLVATVRQQWSRDNVSGTSPMNFTRILTQPVGRYSEKALAYFAANALGELRRRQSEAVIGQYLQIGA